MSFLTDSLTLRLPRLRRPAAEPGFLERLEAAHRLARAAEEGRPLPADALRTLGIERDPLGD